MNMTIPEAIEVLRNFKLDMSQPDAFRMVRAIGMAEEALKKQLTLNEVLEEIEADFDRRIDTQLKIMAGLGDDVYRYGYGKSLEAYQQGKLLVTDIIRKHMNAGWISVKERLPERRGNYLVTVESAWARFILISHYNAPGWTEEYGGQKIIAWQSLPEPYREGKEDAKCIKKQKNQYILHALVY